MADPLSVLRDYVVQQKLDQVKLKDDGRVYFSDQYSFPKATYTAFKSNGPGGDFYDLGSVVYFISMVAAHETARIAEYVAGCKQRGFKPVAFVDRKPLRSYLVGLQDASQIPQIAEAAPAAAPADGEAGPAEKRQRLEEGAEDPLAATLRLLRRQERQLRDRNSMLLAPGANFSGVLQLLDKAQRQDAEKAKDAAAATAAAAAAQKARAAASGRGAPKPAQQAFFKPSGRLERDTRAETARALGQTDEMGLGYGDAALAGGAAPPPPPPPPPPPGSQQQQQQQQQRAPAAQLRREREPQRAAPQAAARGGGKPAAAAAGSGGGGQAGKKRGGVPIILVPAGLSAMINMYNAKQFLEECQFVRSQEAMEANPAKPASLTIKRTMLRDKPTPYVITDKAPAKGSSDWRRVVAVIVQGKAWQFKDFPFKGADTGNLVDTFHNVLGIYPHYADERPPDTVRSWNVRMVPLQREGRFLDRAAVLDVFKALDAFLAARRCELEY